jgi:hypothetical protein
VNRASLRELLDRENVDPRSYAFDSPRPVEQYCLDVEPPRWHVYYAERGLRTTERVYDNEDEACRDLLDRLLRDRTTKRRD